MLHTYNILIFPWVKILESPFPNFLCPFLFFFLFYLYFFFCLFFFFQFTDICKKLDFFVIFCSRSEGNNNLKMGADTLSIKLETDMPLCGNLSENA